MQVVHKHARREYGFVPVEGLSDTRIGTFPRPLLNEARQSGWTVIGANTKSNIVFVWFR